MFLWVYFSKSLQTIGVIIGVIIIKIYLLNKLSKINRLDIELKFTFWYPTLKIGKWEICFYCLSKNNIQSDVYQF